MASVTREHITVDDLRSPLVQAGDRASAEAVVFVHGSPGCAEEFAPWVEQAGEFTRAIAIDSPGFGQADKPSPKKFRYSVPNLGVHLARQLEVLGVERAHFVGHDFGGAFSLLAGAYNPLNVGSMTMIDSGLMRGYQWHFWARLWRRPLLGEFFMAIVNERGFKIAMRDLPEWFIDQMWGNYDRATRRAILALYRNTNMDEQAEQLPQLRLLGQNWPSLVIFGEDDPYLPATLAHRNLEALPKAELHLIPGAGHWPHVDSPQAVEEVLMPFLRAQVGAAAIV